MRLGEKEFVDLMNQTLFMKRENELTAAEDFKVALPDKGTRSPQEVAEKWSQIKVLRNLDVDRLRASSDSKIVTNHDWMVSALLALNK